LLQKVHHLDATVLGAKEVVEMATKMGAQVVGQGSEIGSLEVGKRADLVVLDMMKVNSAPVHDEIANLVYCGSPANVDTVVINGRFVLDEGRFTTIDEMEIMQRASTGARRLVARAYEQN
jgi:5-methylthioadenosine/S-adenosylhomocysteine deaminase